MHVFDDYRPASHRWIHRLVAENPFALLVTCRDGVPRATHVPVLWQADGGADATAAPVQGAVLLGHLATKNDQWHDLAAPDARALVVVQGPQAYVSPTAYRYTPAVPTWNYVAAHLGGPVRLLDGPGALDVVRRTVHHLERRRTPPWDPTASLEHFGRIVDGVRAFALEVQHVDAQFKLSQDKPAQVRAQVRAHLADDPWDAAPALLPWMLEAEAEAEAAAGTAGAGAGAAGAGAVR